MTLEILPRFSRRETAEEKGTKNAERERESEGYGVNWGLKKEDMDLGHNDNRRRWIKETEKTKIKKENGKRKKKS